MKIPYGFLRFWCPFILKNSMYLVTKFFFLCSDKGKLITWGWNEHGLCGNGNEDNIFIPHQVAALAEHVIKMIDCGAGHSFAMINDT